MKTRILSAPLIAAVSVVLAACGSDAASEKDKAGAFGTVKVFNLPGGNTQPFGITSGPDGNLWLTEATGDHVDKVSVDGKVLGRYAIPGKGSNFQAQGIVSGYDDRIWMTLCNPSKIAAVTTDGKFTEYPTPTPKAGPCAITKGPEGKLWFASFEGNLIGSITSEGKMEEFKAPTPKSGTYQVINGPDDRLWVSQNTGDSVADVDTTGDFTEFPLGGNDKSDVAGVTLTKDGSVWFAETTGNLVGKLVLDSSAPNGRRVVKYPMARKNTWPYSMITGPDGNVWFTELGGDRVARITAAGKITEWKLPDGSAPRDLTLGPDGNLWIALSGGQDDLLDVPGNGKAAVARFSLQATDQE